MGQICSRLNCVRSDTVSENPAANVPQQPTAPPDSPPIMPFDYSPSAAPFDYSPSTAPPNSPPSAAPLDSPPSIRTSPSTAPLDSSTSPGPRLVHRPSTPIPSSGLPLVTDEILRQCPRFRVLVVGKSGVGKSSLISHAFGVDTKSVSHGERGICDINHEIVSQQNPRFVLHDSMGFEPGEMENFEKAKIFLKSRSGESVLLKDRVHVIWLCIQVPHAGGRVFETGDEELLKFASTIKVPVVSVFTQFDKLINSERRALPKNTPKDKIPGLSAENANNKFQELCIKPLGQISSKLRYARSSGLSGKPNSSPDRQALDALIKITRDLVEREVEGEAWIVSAMAQRASAQVKINASIEVGMKRYWQGLASSTKFLGWTLEACLNAVHKEMTDSWNFYDPHDLLLSPGFLEKIRSLAQLVTPNESEAKSWFDNLDAIRTWVGLVVGATVAATAGPVIAAIGVSAWFIRFIADAYNNTPETLRCFMGYILDLTLVLHQLFLVVISIRPLRPLTDADIDMALDNYKVGDMGMVHHEIRQYVRDTNILQSNAAETKVKELVWIYSSDPNLRSSTKSL
ncbi:hypothetical protein GGX14DRAFT_446771 [Mycena pura]|uniref:G domain-containing protein n=1 Tax=Mycena pura TaxID=153505 RepID=A0AAD6VL04_9AGAR|nr:hypothetical protein GGX14DRAFT_446771 [Mycena pura]